MVAATCDVSNTVCLHAKLMHYNKLKRKKARIIKRAHKKKIHPTLNNKMDNVRKRKLINISLYLV